MKEFSLNGSLRAEVGKKVAKKLRYDGLVPAIMYGGENTISLSVVEKDLKDLIYTPDVFIINLTIDKKPYKAILKDIQFHPVTDKVVHIDFFQVSEDQKITIALPVVLTGSAEGVKRGGKLNLAKRRLKVHGFIKDLPEVISIDVTDLGIGKSRLVGDLKFDKIEIFESKATVIAMVKTSRVAAKGEDAEVHEDTEEEAPAAEAAE